MSSAWIAAQAGRAVVVTPDDWYLLKAGRSASPIRCTPGELNNLRALAPSAFRIDPGPYPFVEVQRQLDNAWRQENALSLALMTLDRRLSRSLRIRAAQLTEELLSDGDVSDLLRARLLSVPLPAAADVGAAPMGPQATALVTEAREARLLVRRVGDAWAVVVLRHRGTSHDAANILDLLRPAAILRGGFAAVVTSLREHDDRHYAEWVTKLRSDDSVLSRLESLRLLGEWYRCAREQNHASPPLQPTLFHPLGALTTDSQRPLAEALAKVLLWRRLGSRLKDRPLLDDALEHVNDLLQREPSNFDAKTLKLSLVHTRGALIQEHLQFRLASQSPKIPHLPNLA